VTPPVGSAIAAVASVAFKRLTRGAGWIIALVFAAVPPGIAALAVRLSTDAKFSLNNTFGTEAVVLGIVMGLLVAWPVGQDLEDRTAAYVWARPVPRWAILVGKLAVSTPIAIAMFAASWVAACVLTAQPIAPAPIIALSAAVVVASVIASALALLLPRHPLVLALVVLALLDPVVGAMSGGVALATVTYNARVIAGFEPADVVTSACALAALAALWGWVALRKLARTEV
jgi:ABC-type transport system involved in multi-copper enzyme maturation permease subunit